MNLRFHFIVLFALAVSCQAVESSTCSRALGFLSRIRSSTSHLLNSYRLPETKQFSLEGYRRAKAYYREHGSDPMPSGFNEKLGWLTALSTTVTQSFGYQALDFERAFSERSWFGGRTGKQKDTAKFLRKLSGKMSQTSIEQHVDQLYATLYGDLDTFFEYMSRLPHLPRWLANWLASLGHENSRGEELKEELARRRLEVLLVTHILTSTLREENHLKPDSRLEKLRKKYVWLDWSIEAFKSIFWNLDIFDIFIPIYFPYFHKTKRWTLPAYELEAIARSAANEAVKLQTFKINLEKKYKRAIPYRIFRRGANKALLVFMAGFIFWTINHEWDASAVERGSHFYERAVQSHHEIQNSDLEDEGIETLAKKEAMLKQLRSELRHMRMDTTDRRLLVGSVTLGLAIVYLSYDKVLKRSGRKLVQFLLRAAILGGLLDQREIYLEKEKMVELQQLLDESEQRLHQARLKHSKLQAFDKRVAEKPFRQSLRAEQK